MIGDPSNLNEYLVYLQNYQPGIAPRAVSDIKFVIRKGIRPGTQHEESHALPTWLTPHHERVIDWAAFYTDIGFPAFIYVIGYNPLIPGWE